MLAGEFVSGNEGWLVRQDDAAGNAVAWVMQNPVLYFARMTPKSAALASAFQSNVVLSDLPPSTLTRAIAVTITGATYIDANASVTFQNTSSQMMAVTARLNLIGVRAPTYLGGMINNSLEVPFTVPARW